MQLNIFFTINEKKILIRIERIRLIWNFGHETCGNLHNNHPRSLALRCENVLVCNSYAQEHWSIIENQKILLRAFLVSVQFHPLQHT